MLPSDCLRRTPLSLLDLFGKRHDFRYLLDEPQLIPEETESWDETIVRINLKEDRPAVFEVFAQGEETYSETFPEPYRNWWGHFENGWHARLKGRHEYKGDFWPFAHWPISKIPYASATKTMGRWLREPGHTSILGVPGHPGAREATTWAMLVGLSEPGDDGDLREKAVSWLYPGEIVSTDGSCTFLKTDYYQRAIVLESVSGTGDCLFRFIPGRFGLDRLNPVFEVRNWQAGGVTILRDGKPLSASSYRWAVEAGSLILWLKARISVPTEFVLKPMTEK